MDRSQKIEYLKQLAAAKLAPADLLRLLPERVEIFMWSRKDNKFHGSGGAFTRQELNDHRSDYAGPVRRLLIHPRGCGNDTANDTEESDTEN